MLHVPSFPVNLLSLSALVDQIDCRVSFDREHCIIQERRTGKEIGIGVRHGGLWYLEQKEDGRLIDVPLVAGMNEDEARVMLQHCRLGHLSFDTMAKVFPEIMSRQTREHLYVILVSMGSIQEQHMQLGDLEVYLFLCLFTRMCGLSQLSQLVE